jgi:tripartite-type tricarboxylate transporter receptor subunit TctC
MKPRTFAMAAVLWFGILLDFAPCRSMTDAQAYPSRPITVVVPFPAGGPTDALARILSDRMRLTLGQPVVVENVPGAAGTIGVGRVARAAPDGYTLVVGIMSTHVLNAAIYTLQFDPVRDFQPISLIARTSVVIVARKTLPANDLGELIAWLKANPNKALQATAGTGSPQHIAGALFQRLTGTEFQFVPYRGAAPAVQDLMSGQIDIDIDSPVNTLAQIRAGAIRGYAVAAKRRLESAPEIPTTEEAGLPGFYYSDWFGLFAPHGLPTEITSRLNTVVAEALADPVMRQRVSELGLEVPPKEELTPGALATQQKADIEKWWPFIKSAGIKVE